MPNPNLARGSQRVIRSSYSQAILNQSPAAYWRFNQSSGIAVTDSTGNGHEALATGITWESGANPEGNDYAAFFDGLNDSADMTLDSSSMDNSINGINVAAAGTLMIWTKVALDTVWEDSITRGACRFRTDSGRTDIEKASTFQTFRTQTANIEPLGFTVTFSPTGPEDWFPTVVSWSQANDRYRVWINEETVDEQTYAADTFTTINLFTVGLVGTTYWSGWIADVALWTTELSQSVIESVLLVR